MAGDGAVVGMVVEELIGVIKVVEGTVGAGTEGWMGAVEAADGTSGAGTRGGVAAGTGTGIGAVGAMVMARKLVEIAVAAVKASMLLAAVSLRVDARWRVEERRGLRRGRTGGSAAVGIGAGVGRGGKSGAAV